MPDGDIAGFAEPAEVRVESSIRESATRPHFKLIAFLAAGHLVVDLNQGSLPAILPFFKMAHNLSYAAIGTLVLVSNVTSSIVQPVFGYLADRKPMRWIPPSAVILSGLGLALTGFAAAYWMLLVLLVAMGLGVASYHPMGFRTVRSLAGRRHATALSWFSIGGNLGFALGPPILGALLTEFGIYGSAGMFLPAFPMALVFLFILPAFSSAVSDGEKRRENAENNQNMPKAFAILMAVVMVRSWSQLGFLTYMPFYYVDYLQLAPRLVGPLLFVFLGSGAAGTLIAGPLADRWGTRNLTVCALIASVPFAIGFLLTRGIVQVACLGFFGAILISTFSITVVLGQQYLPKNTGLASGLIVGFAMGTGGLGVTFLGGIADRHGIPSVLWISALLPLIAFLGAFLLPSPAKKEG